MSSNASLEANLDAKLTAKLKIEDLRLQVRLGCSEREREIPQEVRFHISFFWDSPPQACFNDNLDQTICYAQVSETLLNFCADRSFHTVEKLAATCLSRIQEDLPRDIKIHFTLHKVKPPIPHLVGGVFFSLDSHE